MIWQSLCAAIMLLPVSAQAMDCSRAATTIERRICATPDLLKQDDAMSVLFRTLEAEAATPNLREALITQQRQWLQRREKGCTDAVCLSRSYRDRLVQLTVYDNDAASSPGGQLETLAAVPFFGKWQVGPLPWGAASEAQSSLSSIPSMSNPARTGETITAKGSQLCASEPDCTDVAWRWERLGELIGARRLEGDLKLPAATPILVGRPSDIHRDILVLLQSGETGLAALSSICLGQNGVCRNVLQPWQALEPVQLPPNAE